MSWFNRKPRKKIKQRKSVIKRRSASSERLITYARKFGVVIGVVTLLAWMGAWFFLSGSDVKTQNWLKEKTYHVSKSAGFEVQNILVEGRKNTDSEILKAILNVEKGDPIFAFNAMDAHKEIQKISWVKDVTVERRLPNTIYIGLEERIPMALWQKDKKLSLIDTQGQVLTSQNLDKYKDFIILYGEEAPIQAPDFMKFLVSEPEILKHVEAAHLKSGRRWDLIIKTGATIQLPEENVELAFRQLVSVNEQNQILEKDIKTIDIRDPTRILVRTHPGAVQKYQAGYSSNTSQGNPI